MRVGGVFGCGLLIALSLAASRSEAQEKGARLGRMAAHLLCADCHATRPGQARSPAASAPTFEAIAAVPGMTSSALRVTLQTSHRTMPNLMLEGDELGEIVDYILSLKPAK
jgi:mono/diheme cytochrome c family protein